METLFKNEIELFPTSWAEIRQRVVKVDPIRYGKTRNYLDGAVTYLSPYISRGVLSTRFVLQEVLNRGFKPGQIEKFIQELAWRDYWQQVWIARGERIDKDLKQRQDPVSNHEIPAALIKARTGVRALDQAIVEFYETGYLHNHMRMYIASLACNVGRCHWSQPARWMYYHLLDADWASNALSWQWVAGTNSHKKYYANQENINKFTDSRQKGTFLDIPYEKFPHLEIPEVLMETEVPELRTPLPEDEELKIDPSLPTLIYNFYNLDPLWHKEARTNRILILEPSVFRRYPVSKKTIDFILALAENVEGIQVFPGEFRDLLGYFDPYPYDIMNVHYKEHPLNTHYRGTEEPRDWMFDVKGDYPSFFAFWKKCRKELSL